MRSLTLDFPPPAPVRAASVLLVVNAALGLLALATTLTTLGTVRRRAAAGSGLTSSATHAVVVTVVASAIVVGVIGAALWLVFAVFVRRGQRWARRATTVLCVLAVLYGLNSLDRGSSITAAADIAELVVSIAVGILVWSPPASRAYFEAVAALTAAHRASSGMPG